MPTRLPGGILTSTTEWAALLAHLEALRLAAEDAAAAARAAETRLQSLEARVRSLETLVSAPTWRAGEGPARPGVLATLEQIGRQVSDLVAAIAQFQREDADRASLLLLRLPTHLGRQVEEIRFAVHRPGEAPRTVGGGLATAITSLEQTVREHTMTLGRQQGGAASVTGALDQAQQRLAVLVQQQQALAETITQLAAAQRASGDQLATLLVQQHARLDGDDALTLLIRLLARPDEVVPLFRRDQFVCFVPERVQQWLLDTGLTRREVQLVRSVWRDTGYVPSERQDNHNKRVKVAGVPSPPYFMVVPITTYAKLRVPIPADLSTEPPRGAR